MKVFIIFLSLFLYTNKLVSQNNAIEVNNNLEVIGFSYPSNFTLEFMIKLDNLNTNILPNFNIDSAGGFSLSFSGNNCIVSQPVFTTNKWYRVSITKDSVLKIYINGILIIQSSNVTSGATDNLQFLNGIIDDIRVWNIALPESFIQYNMYKHLTGTETNLIFYSDLDVGATDATGNYTINNSGNNQQTSLAFSNYNSGSWYGSNNAENIMFLGNNTINFNVSANNVVTEDTYTTIFDNVSTLTINNNYFGSLHFKEGSGLLQNNSSVINTKDIVTESTGQSSEYRYDYWVSPGNNQVTKSYPSVTSNVNQSIISPNYTKTLSTIENLFPIGNNNGEHSSSWIYSSHGGIPYGEAFVQNWSVNPTNRGLINTLGFTLKGANGSSPSLALKAFTAIPENGNHSINFSHIQDEDVLIGNPYPSLISLNQFLIHNQNDIMGSIDHWLHWDGNDHVTSNFVAGYAVQNRLGTALPHDTFSYNGNSLLPNDNIVPHKSFFTWISPTGTQVEFTNAMRIPSNTIEDHSNKNRCWLSLKKESGNLYQRDQILFGAASSTTNNFDYGYDAIHVHDHRQTLIYSFINSDTSIRYKIQSVDPSFTDDIELGVKVNETGNYIFNIELEENMTNADYIFLLDNETSLYYNLRTGPATVAFSSTGFINNRFLLRFNNQFLTTQEYNLADGFLVWQDESFIHVSSPKNHEKLLISLYSIEGRIVLETNQKNISKSQISNGVYIIKIQQENNKVISTKKIIIQ